MDFIAALKNLLKRARQKEAPNDSGDRQTVKVGFLGQTREIKQITPYGLYSSSPVGSEYIVFSARSNPDDLSGIGNIYKERFKNLKEGEVVLYNTKTKSYVYFRADESIEVDSKKDLIANVANDLTATVGNDIIVDAGNNIEATTFADLIATVGGDATIDSTGDVTIDAGGDADVTCTNATITATNATITANVTINGNLTIPTGILTLGAVNINTHVHGGVLSGPNTTTGPQ